MRYKKHRLRILSKAEDLKREGFLKNGHDSESILNALALKSAVNDLNEITDQIEQDLIELNLIRLGCPTIFLESPNLVDYILRSIYIADSEAAFPCDCKLIIVPKESNIPSFLYAVTNSDYMVPLFTEYYEKKYKYMGYPEDQIVRLKKNLSNSFVYGHKVLRIAYQTNDSRLRIRISPLAAVFPIIATDPSILHISLKGCDDENDPFDSDEEIQSVNQMIRIALGQTAYRQAVPENIQVGTPDINAIEGLATVHGEILTATKQCKKGNTSGGATFKQGNYELNVREDDNVAPKESRWEIFEKDNEP